MVPPALRVTILEVSDELPDSIKDIDMKSFGYNVQPDGKITFEIFYEAGALPEIFPEPRARKTRRAKGPATVAEVAAISEQKETEEPASMLS